MTQVWMYSLAASSNPDHVSCVVPWLVDPDLIFFGPCKKRIRGLLRRRFLGESISHAPAPATEDLFIVGVNGSNKTRSRKIVWAGRLSEVMTFAEADNRLVEIGSGGFAIIGFLRCMCARCLRTESL